MPQPLPCRENRMPQSKAQMSLHQGVWAATATMQLVRRMEWRPPLLYAYPLGHRVLDHLNNH